MRVNSLLYRYLFDGLGYGYNGGVKKRFLSFLLTSFLAVIFMSPFFGWHIHHACRDGCHGFESHSSHAHHGGHHCKDCQSESLFQHAFEQGASTNALVSEFVHPLFTDIYIRVSFHWIELRHPQLETATYSRTPDPDIGKPSYVHISALLRAPPTLLS